MPDTKDNKLTRKDAFEKEKIDVVMPECRAIYLVEYLYEIGPTIGDDPINHVEIQAWMSNTGIELQSWEARLMRRLSLEYLSEYQKARKAEAIAPWEDAPYYMSPTAIAAQNMKRAMEEMAAL